MKPLGGTTWVKSGRLAQPGHTGAGKTTGIRGPRPRRSKDEGGRPDGESLRILHVSDLHLNPAGIDLADGTFWDGLKLTTNSWVTVTR